MKSWLLTKLTLAACLVLASSPPLYAQSSEPLSLVWTSNETAVYTAGAWGDFDNDGDLDLAVSKTGGSVVYRNEGVEANSAQMKFSIAWQSTEQNGVEDIAWGDYDGDGWLDLAVANLGNNGLQLFGVPNRIYRNQGQFQANGTWDFRLVWSSSEAEISTSVAWGDVDNDGDLDLAVSNEGQANRLYRNDGSRTDHTPILTTIWTAQEVDHSSEVSWGDLNKDGWLDLAVANGSLNTGGEPERVYVSQQGALPTTATWSSNSTDTTFSVAWGDADGDGDLDLATGNGRIDPLTGIPIGEPNHIYRNDNGSLTTNPIWTSLEADTTLHLTWGDLDNDGDVDLIAGNDGLSRLYRNDRAAADNTLHFAVEWSSAQTRTTFEVAPADINNDGVLDLALINGNNVGQAIQLYRNQVVSFSEQLWGTTEAAQIPGLAWGDSDGDGDLDLTASYRQGQTASIGLYQNQNGVIRDAPDVTVSMVDSILKMAWGDVDGDYDLDLVALMVTRGLVLFRNQGGELQSSPIWQPNEEGRHSAMAWGDYDGDGDLDLAATIDKVKLYRNDGGVLTSDAVWTAPESTLSPALAWGDVDNDGDLDLAISNWDEPILGGINQTNQLYRNDGVDATTQVPIFTIVWSSQEFSPTTFDNITSDMAWGDVDGDGDLDLATSDQGGPTRLYRNDNGELTTRAIWRSQLHEATHDIEWGDYDNDGDLDLITVSGGITEQGATPVGKENRLYRNERGQLNSQAVWLAPDLASTWRVGWGDVDNDGDLDLAFANLGSKNQLYHNNLYPSIIGVNSPPRITLRRPGFTAGAGTFSSAEVLTTTTIAIPYTLFDAEGDAVARLFPEFSPTGGGQWFPATPASGGDGVVNLSASPQGTEHLFLWHAATDMTKSDNVVFRLRAQPGYTNSPIYWAAPAAQSPSFRVAPPWYIRVVDEAGNPVSGAQVYANGQPIAQTYMGRNSTDQAGLLVPLTPPIGASLVAIQQVAEEPTSRQHHDGWAYRTYLTSLAWDNEGVAQPVLAGATGEQRLVLRKKNPLVLFNLVVSVEWAAGEAYLQQLAHAFQSASNYLHDLTDGQMAFGQVAIYENGVHWADADIQVGAKRGIHPHAYIGGITATDSSHVMVVGRGWNRSGDDRRAWDEPDGYRTLVHEFGHYGLYLYDEYIALMVDSSGNLQGSGVSNVHCISSFIREGQGDETTNASAMYWQYHSSELSARGPLTPPLWSKNCDTTLQTQQNKTLSGVGESTWETIARVFANSASPVRWQIETPTMRGTVWAGPDRLPAALPNWPQINISTTTHSSTPIALTVYADNAPYADGALVTLYQSPLNGSKVLGQGMSNGQGQLEIVGANVGDTLRAASLDGGYAGAVTLLSTDQQVELQLRSAAAVRHASTEDRPYVRILPELNSNAAQIQLTFQLYHFNAQNEPGLAVTLPGLVTGSTPVVAYSPTDNLHRATVAFAASQGGSGELTVFGQSNTNQAVYLASNYRLHLIDNDQAQTFFADDGGVQLYLPTNSTPGAQTLYVINPLATSPGPLLSDARLAGEIYEITASGSIVQLDKPGILSFHYEPEVLPGAVTTATLGIYRWDVGNAQWVKQEAILDQDRHLLSATIQRLGTYALFYHSVAPPLSHPIYLPVIKQ
ncbi:MAG: VCBS repeat-containing protein [Caldilineaceae bacterium]